MSESKPDETFNPMSYDLSFENRLLKAAFAMNSERFTYGRLSYFPVNVNLGVFPAKPGVYPPHFRQR